MWLEVAQCHGNKGGKDLEAFWDQQNVEWGKVLNSLSEGALSLNEEVLLGRLESSLASILMPLYMSSLE